MISGWSRTWHRRSRFSRTAPSWNAARLATFSPRRNIRSRKSWLGRLACSHWTAPYEICTPQAAARRGAAGWHLHGVLRIRRSGAGRLFQRSGTGRACFARIDWRSALRGGSRSSFTRPLCRVARVRGPRQLRLLTGLSHSRRPADSRTHRRYAPAYRHSDDLRLAVGDSARDLSCPAPRQLAGPRAEIGSRDSSGDAGTAARYRSARARGADRLAARGRNALDRLGVVERR